jgi:predicted DNA-binding transcriptional regulator AlpA
MTKKRDVNECVGISLLGIKDVADLLGVTSKSIRRYVDSGSMPPPIRLAGRTLQKWRYQDIEAWINDQVISDKEST